VVLAASAVAASLVFDQADGSVGWRSRASLHDFTGRARVFAGSLDTDAMLGSIDVPAADLTTGLGPRDARLLIWCLEVADHPWIRFALRTAAGGVATLRTGEGNGALLLRGTLRIRDVEREVDVPTSFGWEGDRLRLKGETALRIDDWGIPDPSILASRMDPEVTVTFDVVAHPE
jgi:polyisoprenoid-binding protein YceI